MSFHVVRLVRAARIGSPNAKSVLKELAEFANDHGGSCFPSQETLAAYTDLSLRQVQRALAELRELGVITVVAEACRGRAARYQLQLDRIEALIPPRPQQPKLPLTSLREVRKVATSGNLSGEKVATSVEKGCQSEAERLPLQAEKVATSGNLTVMNSHENSHETTTTPYPPPGAAAGGGGGGGGQEKIQPRSIHSRETLLRYAWASHVSRGGAIRNPQSFAEKRLADGEADLAVSIWLELVGSRPRAAPAGRSDEAAQRLGLAEIISGHERRHWQITAELLDRADPAEIAAKARELLARAGPLHQWEAVVIEYANHQALRALRKGIA